MAAAFLGVVFGLACSHQPTRAAAWRAERVPTPPTGLLNPTGGPVYYRCFIRVPDAMTSRADVDLMSDSAMLSFADLPGPFTIFLNGQKIGEGESIAPEPRRRFKIPKGILEKKAFNALAVRLEGDAAKAGLRVEPVLHSYHDELVLDGPWQIHPGEPGLADLRAVTVQPATAFFTEKNFREASTPLAANAELVRGRRLSPAESMASMHTPPDLQVDLMLHEPAVAQPTHFSFDERGRLWVAQYRQYPYPAGLKMVSRDKYYRAVFDRVPPAPPHHDRGHDIISVHEDSDGDGFFDRRREVLTGLNMANSVLHGHGGIWVMHTPYLLFYPDADGDDVPDRDPEVRLAGFGLEDTHSIANGLAWGPDGWIYGAQGSTTTSHIRRPGIDSPDSPGVYYESCMVWRYHPDTHDYEIFAEGGGNNFGLEFDAEGRVYSGHNGGETRGWHYAQSGIYLKQGKDPGKFGPPANPFTFGELPMMKTTNKITRFSHHFAIAEGTALPQQYVGRLFSADPLHHKIVVSERTRNASTFATSDLGFALESDDKAFRPVFVGNAPDGAIYVADFYEEYIAHGQNYQGQIDPDSGRIYRIRGKDSALNKDNNLAKKTTAELIATLSHPNKWHRQTAVRLLGERRDPVARDPLKQLLQNRNPHPALEALWALHQAGWLDEATALAALNNPAAPVRAWAIRLIGDRKQLPETFASAVNQLVASEPDPEVRCQIASTARRLSAHQALPLVSALLRRDADANDPFIPQLCWWTLEGFCESARPAVLAPFISTNRAAATPPLWGSTMARTHILPHLARRFASTGLRSDLLVCAQLIRAAPSGQDRKALLTGFEEAFKGQALPPLPDELTAALAEAGQTSLVLRVRQGDPDAIQQAIALMTNSKAKREDRLSQIRTFGEVRHPTAIPALLALAKEGPDLELRRAAMAALTRYDDPSIGRELAQTYLRFPPALQPIAQIVLTSRTEWSRVFFGLLESGALKPADVSPEAIARLHEQSDQKIQGLVSKFFPKKATALRADTRLAVERILAKLKAGPGNPYAGEPIFDQRCASCHQLFHKGGHIGPNLTMYQRDDLGTMLPSVLDPSAEIREGFLNYVVETKDGRTLSGFLAEQDANVVVLRGLDGENVTIARAEIADLKPTGASLMPEGLLEGLSDQQLRDLFAYLRIPQPISR